jgi:hypothetical protein
MLLNNDLLFIVGSVLFYYRWSIISFKYSPSATRPTENNSKSLVNTNSNLDTTNHPATSQFSDVGVQTEANIQVDVSVQAANTYVNSPHPYGWWGVYKPQQRIWLESIRNWIYEILGSGTSNPNPQATGQYVDVGVQTNATSLWATVKQWFLEVCSIRSSQISSIGYNKVEKWKNNLDSDQSVDLHNSDSSLTTFKFESDSELQNLVDPNDSASQISEVVSNSATNINSSIRVFDMNNRADVLDLMIDPTVVFSNDPVAGGDDLITFYTADSANEILRSTLEALLNSVN